MQIFKFFQTLRQTFTADAIKTSLFRDSDTGSEISVIDLVARKVNISLLQHTAEARYSLNG